LPQDFDRRRRRVIRRHGDGDCLQPRGSEFDRAPPRPAGKSPTFLVAALKGPAGANLDRIQIVKGWIDPAGKAQEKIYVVAWSGNRKPGKNGKLPPVGDTVDVARDLDQHDRRV